MNPIRTLACAIVFSLAAAPAAAVVYSTGITGFTSKHSGLAYANPGDAWRMVAQADFDGNGYGDFAWRNTVNGQVSIALYDASGAGARQFVYIEPNMAWKIVGTGDFNGDGKADLVWRNSSTGLVWGMVMNGTTIVAQGQIHAEPNTAWKIVGGGDFAGTSYDNQLLWRNDASGEVYLQSVYWAAGRFIVDGGHAYSEPNLDWEIVGAADFDVDGKADILYRNRASGILWLLLMDGRTVKAAGQVYVEADNNWKIVALNDYDGDGGADILWRHDLTGEVYMLRTAALAEGLGQFVQRDAEVMSKVVGGVADPQGQ